MRPRAFIVVAGTVLVALLLHLPNAAWAQERAGEGEESARRERLGRFHAGPFHVTPYLRINTITLDTNVFYDAENRVTDVYGSGGPGLRLVVPLSGALRINLDGLLDYHYFVKTSGLRRLTGQASGDIVLDTNFIRLSGGRAYRREFDRPDSEVYDRVERETWTTNIDIDFKKLERSRRLTASTALKAERVDVASGQAFDGVDLRAANNRDVYLGGLELSYKLTDKTSLVATGEYEVNQFTLDETRDADVLRVYGGFRLESETRLSGEVLAGIDEVRPTNSTEVAVRRVPFVRSRLTYRFGTKTRLEGSYNRGQGFSIYQVAQGFPTRRSESVGARLVRELTDRLDLWLLGRYSLFQTDDPVENAEGMAEIRTEEYWDAGVNLGYAFRDQVRVGVQALYRERGGRIVRDLGIDGLMIGLTVQYRPD